MTILPFDRYPLRCNYSLPVNRDNEHDIVLNKHLENAQSLLIEHDE